MAGLSAAAFSTSGPFGLSLTAVGWSPGAAVTARAGIAAVLLAAPATVSLRGRWRELRRHAGLVILGVAGALPMHAVFGTVQLAGHRTNWLVPAVGLAVVAMAVADVTGIAAARTLRPRLASFAAPSEVIFAVLTAWLPLGRRPAMTQLAGRRLHLGRGGRRARRHASSDRPGRPAVPAASRCHGADLSRGLPSATHQEEP